MKVGVHVVISFVFRNSYREVSCDYGWNCQFYYINSSSRGSVFLWTHCRRYNSIPSRWVLWGFGETGSSTYSLWVGARLATGLSTSFSGFAILTSLELWAEPPPRPTEGEFPIADRRSGWAKDYTWRQNWAEIVDPEKLGCQTGFDLIRLSNSSGDLPLVSELLPVELGWSLLFPVELGSSRFDFSESDLRGIRGRLHG